MEVILGQFRSYKLRDKWLFFCSGPNHLNTYKLVFCFHRFKQWDYAYIRPLLIRDKSAQHEPKILQTYSKLTLKDAINFAQCNPSSWLDGQGRGNSKPASVSSADLVQNHTAVDLFTKYLTFICVSIYCRIP